MKPIKTLGVALALTVAATAGQAAEWPSKPVQIIVPSKPGGGTDVMARIFSDYLARETGGAYFAINQLDELAGALPNRIRRLETRSQPIPLWDTNRVLFLLVALLGLEWAVRKKLKML